jgi:hypothetical protein
MNTDLDRIKAALNHIAVAYGVADALSTTPPRSPD